MLDENQKSEPDDALVRADRLASEGKHADAAKAYEEALKELSKKSPKYGRAAESYVISLQMTQQSLSTVQNQVSTGLKVATAADNSSYWSIAAQLTADSGVVSASNDALSQGQSVLATASSAINSVITTINSIQTALTQATEPGANIGNINVEQERANSPANTNFQGGNQNSGDPAQNQLNRLNNNNDERLDLKINDIEQTGGSPTSGSVQVEVK